MSTIGQEIYRNLPLLILYAQSSSTIFVSRTLYVVSIVLGSDPPLPPPPSNELLSLLYLPELRSSALHPPAPLEWRCHPPPSRQALASNKRIHEIQYNRSGVRLKSPRCLSHSLHWDGDTGQTSPTP